MLNINLAKYLANILALLLIYYLALLYCTHRNKTTKDTKMEAIVSYCNAMSYHQPATHSVYVGEIGERSDEWILRTAARQINWNGSITEKEMGSLEIIGYQPCVD